MARMTKDEKNWIKKLQKVLDSCPSNRIGFYTIGDRDVKTFDRGRIDEICDIMDNSISDFGPACNEIGAEFEECLYFPSAVEGTAG